MFTSRSIVLTGAAAALTLAAATAPASGAPTRAATPIHHSAHHPRFVTSGHAFGSRVQVSTLAGSGRSARTTLHCGATHKTRHSATAHVRLSTLGLARAVRSRSLSQPNAHGKVHTIERARAARLSLLNNLITAKAVTATATAHPRKLHATTARTRFIGLRIAGKLYSNNPKPNTSLTIPGIARLTLNAQHRTVRHGLRKISVDALRLTLLKGSAFGPLGTTVVVGHALASRHSRHKSMLRGASSGSQVRVGGLVVSNPTFQTKMPCGGKHGAAIHHKGVGVNLKSLLKTGVIKTRAKGHQRHASQSRTRATVARVNLLGGAITAKAVRSQAIARLAKGRLSASDSGSSFLGLRIGGKKYSNNPAPNTQINLLGIGTLWLNRVVPTAHGVQVHAIELVLGHAFTGLSKGTVVDVANAKAFVRS